MEMVHKDYPLDGRTEFQVTKLLSNQYFVTPVVCVSSSKGNLITLPPIKWFADWMC
ncbi:hypothetical protein pfor_2c0072 [Rhodobacteraceae bacterium SB2]|nr:hypothetical protein pfor_2c0072 [Rhodobacteraceae bacterium SB2]